MYDVLLKACSDESFLLDVARENDLAYKVLQLMPTFSQTIGGTMLMEFNTNQDKMEDVVSYINGYNTECLNTIDFVEVEKKSDEDYFLLMKFGYYLGSEVFLKSGCLFNGCRCDKNCLLIDIYTAGNGSLYNFIEALKSKDYKIEIVKKRNFDINGNLTSRQKHVLHNAFELGYFDIPKRISLKELSTEIGISPSSTDEIIKRAQKKIISSYLMR